MKVESAIKGKLDLTNSIPPTDTQTHTSTEYTLNEIYVLDQMIYGIHASKAPHSSRQA